MMQRLLLIRHGEMGQVVADRFQGSSDHDLGPEGCSQADALTGLVDSFHPTHCFSSPLKRAFETGRRALGSRFQEMDVLEDLRELNFGEWDGCTFDDVQTRSPDLVSQWVADEHSFVFPGGESVAGFHLRVASLLKVLEGLGPASVVLFTHGGVIRSLLCHLLDIPPTKHRIFSVRCGAAAVVETHHDSSSLLALNVRNPKDIAWPR